MTSRFRDWSKRRKVARGQYEIATSSAREAKAIERAAYAGLVRVARPRPPPVVHELRTWSLPCDDCGHVGTLRASLTQLRRWIDEGKVVCTQCGAVKTRKQPI